MQTNNHKIVDYDAVLDARFGAEGTPERVVQRKMLMHSILVRFYWMPVKRQK